MDYDLNASRYDLNRPHNPWEHFTRRHEDKHYVEDASRLCPSLNVLTPNVVEAFLAHKRKLIENPIPRQRQVLRDFLKGVEVPQATALPRYVEADIKANSTDNDIALLDDRQRHSGCAKSIGKPCSDCRIFSTNLKIPELLKRLGEEVG
tara:strand:- start:1285 stop:1731 length:447 start_codon:yes stop_codon:yes gene_type:complete